MRPIFILVWIGLAPPCLGTIADGGDLNTGGTAARGGWGVIGQGGFVEGLFRSIADAQLDRARRDANQGGNRNVIVPPSRNVPVPSQPGVNDRIDARRISPGPSPLAGPDRLSQRGPATSSWQSLRQNLEALNVNVQREATVNSNLRRLVPDVYRLSAQVRSMAEIAASGRESQIAPTYPAFDRDYRTLSYAVRSAAGISVESKQLIRESDRLVSRLDKIYGVQPQWDKRRFKDIVLTTEIYLRALLDDLDLISMAEGDRRSLTHDLRILTRRLVEVRRVVDEMDYSSAAEAFNRFSADITPVATSLRQLRNPHVDRRLDRLAELADETYGLLWMQAPVTSGSVLASAQRLETSAETLRRELSSDVLQSVDRGTRNRIDDLAREVDRGGHALVDTLRRDRTGRSAGDLIRQVDAASSELAQRVQYLRGNHHAAMALVRSEVDALIRVTGTPLGRNTDIASLVPAAATLEGTSEVLRDEIRRVDRYIEPSSLRGDLRRWSDDLYRSSRRLHEAVADRRDVETIRGRATELIEPWQQLSGVITNIRRYGVRESQARTMQQYVDAMAPAIGDVAALLGL